MSGFPGGLMTVSVSGLTDVNQNLININRQLSNLFEQLAAIAIIPPGTASQAGTNIFTGSNTFKLPPEINAGSVGTGQVLPMGALSQQFSVAGVGNGADTTDDTLFSYTLPASSLDANGRSVEISAFGKFANNGNNKAVKLWFGSSLIFTSGVQTVANVGWWGRLTVTRTGAGAQIGWGAGGAGTVVFSVPVPLIGTETSSGAIVIKVTGASTTTGAAGDVVGNGLAVIYRN